MSITEYNSVNEISDYQEVNIGKLFFFEDYMIAEFKEGITINFENFQDTAKAIISYFGDREFGIITNRTNSYSLDLSDAKHFNKLFPKLKAYAVVSKSLFAKGVFEVENQFFNYNRSIFSNVDDAITWVEDNLKPSI